MIYLVEDMNFLDALWWSLVTTTTVGYGDISPITGIGKFIAAILMITGIGFLGMLTATISTFFIEHKTESLSYKDKVIKDIQIKLNNYDELTKDDIDQIYKVLLALKEK